MKTILIACMIIPALLASVDVPRVDEWYGTSPLRSTRQEVERRLGTSNAECKCSYETPRERIFVKYSSGDCNGSDPIGWNVPRDTVVGFEVFPKRRIKFSDLNVDEKSFTKTEETELPGAFLFSSKERGISFEVDNDLVVGFYYEPTVADARFRCRHQRSDKPVAEESRSSFR